MSGCQICEVLLLSKKLFNNECPVPISKAEGRVVTQKCWAGCRRPAGVQLLGKFGKKNKALKKKKRENSKG